MTEQERAAFEAHMRGLGYHGGELEQHHNGHYWNDEVSAAWIAWQARAAQAATPAPAEPVEPVEQHFEKHLQTYAEKHPALLVRKLAGALLEARNKQAATPAPEPHPDTADAERYRWLRERYQILTNEMPAKALGLDLRRLYVNTREKFDAAIDAARAVQGMEASK